MLKIKSEIFIYIYIVTLYLFSSNISLNFINNILGVIIIGFGGIRIIKRKEIKINYLYSIFGFFLIISLIVGIGSVSQSSSMVKIKTLIQIYILNIAIYNLVKKEQIYNLLKSFIIAVILLSIYTLLSIDFVNKSRVGGGNIGNANGIATLLGTSFIFTMYYFFDRKGKKYLGIGALIATAIFFTGSRKGIFLIVISLFGVLLIYTRCNLKNILKNGLIGLIAMVAIGYAIFEIPILYDIAGKRVESLINPKSEIVDYSGEERDRLGKYGIELIKDNMIIGVGLDNFKYHAQRDIGIKLYSHNNFIEVTTSTGIIGFIIYYSMYGFVLLKLYLRRRAGNKLDKVFFLFVLINIFLGVGLVQYYNKFTYIYLTIIVIWLSNEGEKKLEH